MPIYEYRCSSCGHELEALQKLSEAPLTSCPSCAQQTLVKLVSAAGFQLKGSGWYATDFRSNGGKPSKPADADKSPGGEAKGDAKGDAKSDAPAAASCGSGCACH
jgi:putative FmdB family regulatory protein